MKSKKNDADASGSGSSEEEAEYVVEKICSRRVRKGKVSATILEVFYLHILKRVRISISD